MVEQLPHKSDERQPRCGMGEINAMKSRWKRWSALLLAMLLSAGLSACGRENSAADAGGFAGGVRELALAAVSATGRDPEQLTQLNPETAAAYVTNVYGIAGENWEDCAIYQSSSAEVYEVGVLELADEADADAVVEALEQYIHGREGDFTGYAPDQAAIAAGALAVAENGYAAVLICEEPEPARQAFLGLLRGEPEAESSVLHSPETERDAKVSGQSAAAGESGPDSSEQSAAAGESSLDLSEQSAAAEESRLDSPEQFEAAGESSSDLSEQSEVAEESGSDSPEQSEAAEESGPNSPEQSEAAGENESEAAEQSAPAEENGEASDEQSAAVGKTSSTSPETREPLRDLKTGRILFTDPEKNDMTVYDTAAIMEAWRNRDASGLDTYDRAIYDAAEAVLAQILTDDMSDLEKEQAIYAWLTWNVIYDWTMTDPKIETGRDSFTPYGSLVNRQAVCLGFASAFQLLMNMADLECITVVGAAFESAEDHAWNMVRLDGVWVCADPTWDIRSSRTTDPEWEHWGPDRWAFFNVTSDYMAETDHQWDYDAVPET